MARVETVKTKIIKAALRKLNAYDQNGAPEGHQMVNGTEAFDFMLQAWKNIHSFSSMQTTYYFTTVAGSTVYQLLPGATNIRNLRLMKVDGTKTSYSELNLVVGSFTSLDRDTTDTNEPAGFTIMYGRGAFSDGTDMELGGQTFTGNAPFAICHEIPDDAYTVYYDCEIEPGIATNIEAIDQFQPPAFMAMVYDLATILAPENEADDKIPVMAAQAAIFKDALFGTDAGSNSEGDMQITVVGG